MASSLGDFAPFTMEHLPGAPATNGHSESGEKPLVQGVLEMEVHQAKGLHNICIYAKQDVYAKLTLTRAGAPLETFYTEVVDKGGKDPVFNQKFATAVVESDCVLRCEVWMASKMRDYLQDQLLGLVSIPLSDLVSAGRFFSEFGLSSTELFHAPSGSICMTLEFVEGLRRTQSSEVSQACNSASSNLSESEAMESRAVEFTDPADAREDEQLVSDFIQRASKKQNVEGGGKEERIFTGPPFLHLGVEEKPEAEHTDEHPGVETEKTPAVVVDGEKTSPVSRNLKQLEVAVSTTSSSLLESTVTTNGLTPSSKPKKNEGEEAGVEFRVEVKPEPRIVQEEIMDMYMKSMQQFSEALAKMQLPVDENGMIKLEESGETAAAATTTTTTTTNASTSSGSKEEEEKQGMSKNSSSSESGEKAGDLPPKKSSQRVFYGSRAFF